MAQINRLTGSTDEFIKLIRRIEGRVSTLETRGTGPIFVSDQIVTQDPLTGVETIFGALPDGRHGMQEWVNDTEPPPKPSAPVVSGSRALYELVWDGLDSSGLPQPYDYDRTVVQMASEAPSLIWVEVGSLSAAGRLIIANQEPGQKKLFRLVSYDKNKNMSTPSDSVASTLTSFTQTPEMIAYMKEMQAWVDAANGRLDQAKTDVESANTRLNETEVKLNTTASDISGLTGTIGNINRSVSEAEQKAANAEAAAQQATTIAGSAVEQYDELRIKLDSALAAKPGLISDSGFELTDQWQGDYGASIIASSAARSGSKVIVLPYNNTSTATDKAIHLYSLQDIQVVKDHQYRLTVYIYSTGEVSPDAAINFITRRGATGNRAYLNATERVKLVDLGVSEANWRVFQTTWTAPESYDVNFGVQARSLSSNIYLDDFQIVDSTQEASLQVAVEDARQKAEAASAKAIEAMTAAGQAQTSANGKSSVIYTTTPFAGNGTSVGDTNYVMSTLGGGGVATRTRRWTGTSWEDIKLGHQVISSVDLGTATVGELNGIRIKGKTVTADKLLVGVGDNLIPWSSVSSGQDTAPHTVYGTGSTIQTYRVSDDSEYGLLAKSDTAGTAFRSSLWLSSGGLHDSGYGRDFPASPGKNYKFSMFVRAGGTYSEGIPSTRMFIGFRKADGTNAGIVIGTAKTLTWTEEEYSIDVTAPADAASMYLLVQSDRPGSVWIFRPSFREMVEGSLIVNGTITGKHVNATSVAAEIGQFVKVQAQNVEVTGDLAARLVSSMRTETKNLVVTESAVMQHITAIEGVITPKITVLSGDIINAQNAATQAQRAADEAAAEAREAAGLAGTKGEVIYQATAPTGAQANATNLWIRSSDNKPHTWSGTNWVARTDKAATDAAAAASTARTAATAAKAKIDSVTTTELGATVIDGGKILTDSITAKSIHVDTELSANVARFMDASARNLIVTGSATLPADTYIKGLTADAVKAIKIEVSQLTAANSNFDTAVVNRLWAQKIQSQKIFASEVIIGTGANLIANGFGELGDNTNFSNFSINSTNDVASPIGCQHTYWTTSTGGQKLDQQWKVAPGKTYFWELNTMGQNAGQRFYVQIQWFDSSGSLVSSPYLISNQDPTQSWKLWSGQITAPANAVSAGMILYGNHPNGTRSAGQWHRWGGLVFQEAAGGNLIVNGSITTRHINTETFDVTQLLRANSIEAKYLKVDEIKNAVSIDSNIFVGKKYYGGSFFGSQFSTTEGLGARVLFNSGGIYSYDQSNRKTFEVNSSTGDVELVGTFSTAPVGQPGIRIVNSANSWNNSDLGIWYTLDGNPYGWGVGQSTTVQERSVAGVFLTPDSKGVYWNTLRLRGRGRFGDIMAYGGLTITPGANNSGRKPFLFLDGTSSQQIVSNAELVIVSGSPEYHTTGRTGTGGGDLRLYTGSGASKFYARAGDTVDLVAGASMGFEVGNGSGIYLKSAGMSRYNKLSSKGGTLRIAADGCIVEDLSSADGKRDIQPAAPDERIFDVQPVTYIERGLEEEFERLDAGPRPMTQEVDAALRAIECGPERMFSAVAEDVHDLGLTELVNYDLDDKPASLRLEVFALKLLPFVKELWEFKKKYQPIVEELEELLPKLRELTA